MDDLTSKNENGERLIMLFGVNIAAKRSKVNDTTMNHSFNTQDENQKDDERNENHDSGRSFDGENQQIVKNWTMNEHKAFLEGLKTFGKGKWKDISSNYVKTKNATQVASHAQKFFLRLKGIRKTKRKSIFDMKLDYEDSKTPSPSPSLILSPGNSI
ncbi:transcription factor MYB1R1-like [Vicia villosa]|uniref:transcription factor MYB1R1-like n=1 Tax=Vicia villosa TaxID=3911 RepID=UPI00273ABCC6|nr:transcription factor MYB1R1-like [Vicia villosa]